MLLPLDRFISDGAEGRGNTFRWDLGGDPQVSGGVSSADSFSKKVIIKNPEWVPDSLLLGSPQESCTLAPALPSTTCPQQTPSQQGHLIVALNRHNHELNKQNVLFVKSVS